VLLPLKGLGAELLEYFNFILTEKVGKKPGKGSNRLFYNQCRMNLLDQILSLFSFQEKLGAHGCCRKVGNHKG